MERPSMRILSGDDQHVLWMSVAVFLVVSSCYFWQRSIIKGGLVDFDEIRPRAVQFVVDVNRAPWQEFANLPGIGEKLAKEIVADRDKKGHFLQPEQLTRVRGVGERKLQAIRPYLSLTRSESNAQKLR